MNILIFNAGSSSLKFKLFETALPEPLTDSDSAKQKAKLRSLYQGHFDNHGKPIVHFEKAVKNAVSALVRAKKIKKLSDVAAIGHRVVHGGDTFTKPTRITPAVFEKLAGLSKLAPLHNPPNLACIAASRKLFPNTPHIAVFDTAFHHTMPEKAYMYGLPFALSKRLGIRRFGFHGTSHRYVFETAKKRLGAAKTRRTVTCHLGNGCSIAAIKNGKVIDTSMGFTPLEGIPMGTRSGDIDPAIIFYLQDRGFSVQKVEQLLQKKSGLLGVSQISSDVRDLWAAYKKGNKKARRALEWFAYRIAKYIGAYAAALGGLDCLIFTGGIGENAWYLRRWILAYLRHLPKKKVLVIHTDEEKQIAEETLRQCRYS